MKSELFLLVEVLTDCLNRFDDFDDAKINELCSLVDGYTADFESINLNARIIKLYGDIQSVKQVLKFKADKLK